MSDDAPVVPDVAPAAPEEAPAAPVKSTLEEAVDAVVDAYRTYGAGHVKTSEALYALADLRGVIRKPAPPVPPADALTP